MTLDHAKELVHKTDAAMAHHYRHPVFDEYAIVRLTSEKQQLVWYHGPREPEFIKNFAKETAALWAEARSKFSTRYHVGDFEFTPEGHGSKSEAFLVVGEGLYLIFGNTRLSMEEISKNPLWLRAQEPFVSMSERFRMDPLALSVSAQA